MHPDARASPTRAATAPIPMRRNDLEASCLIMGCIARPPEFIGRLASSPSIPPPRLDTVTDATVPRDSHPPRVEPPALTVSTTAAFSGALALRRALPAG